MSRGAGLGPGISSHSRRGHLGPMRIMYHSVKKGGKPCPKLDLVLALSWPKAVCSPVMSAWPGNTCFPPTSYLLASTPQAKGSPCMHNCPWPGIGSVAPDVNGASRGHCPAQSLAREACHLPSLQTSQAQASRQLSGPAQPMPCHPLTGVCCELRARPGWCFMETLLSSQGQLGASREVTELGCKGALNQKAGALGSWTDRLSPPLLGIPLKFMLFKCL